MAKSRIYKHNYQEVVGDTSKLGPAPKLLNYAMYPNGKEGIYELIKNETKFPEKGSKPKNGGKVLLKYVVNKVGGIEDIEVIISVGKPFDREAIRVLKKMERWIPGKLDNKDVNSALKLVNSGVLEFSTANYWNCHFILEGWNGVK